MTASDLLFLNQLMGNANNQVVINVPAYSGYIDGGLKVVGYMENDFSTQLSNNWGQRFEMQDNANQMMQQFQSGKLIGNLNDTIATYKMPQAPQFQFSFYVWKLSLSDDIFDKLLSLYHTVLPDSDNWVEMKAPLGYNAGFDGNATTPFGVQNLTGTISIKAGKWFNGTNLIVSTLNLVWANKIASDGSPIYAKVDINVRPYRVPTASEFINYFVLPQITTKK